MLQLIGDVGLADLKLCHTIKSARFVVSQYVGEMTVKQYKIRQ